MAFQFNGFRATKPVVRLIDEHAFIYEVFFVLYDTSGRKHNMRFKRDLNNRPAKDRRPQAIAMAQVLWEALQTGWNPLLEKYPRFDKEEQELKRMNFIQALEFAMDIKRPHLSKYSAYDYDGCVRFITKAAKKADYEHTDITKIDRKDIRLIIATAKELNEWSNKARNKYLTILKALLTILADEERIKFNPAHGIKNEPEEKGGGYKRLTDGEKETIAKSLYTEHPDFFDYLMFIYQSGIRRTELLQVQVGDINLQRRCLTIRGDVAKSNRERTVPLPDDLYEIIMHRQVWELDKGWYLFSNDKFKPGPIPYHPNTPTNWWRDIVIKGMGIDCKMYSLKHKGADDKIEAGMPLDVLKTLYGHRSKQMTEIYAQAVKEKYQEQIIEKSPSFAKVINIKREAK